MPFLINKNFNMLCEFMILAIVKHLTEFFVLNFRRIQPEDDLKNDEPGHIFYRERRTGSGGSAPTAKVR